MEVAKPASSTRVTFDADDDAPLADTGADAAAAFLAARLYGGAHKRVPAAAAARAKKLGSRR